MSEVTVERIADEIREQPRFLDSFARSKLRRLPAGTIFVGAGDSYAAAVSGFYASMGRCLAMDPYSLAAYPRWASGREVVFVSASGRTSSNIAAAKRVKGIARRTWAVTANERSSLARSVEETVRIPMEYVPRMPGTLSFTLSLLAVLRMSMGEFPSDFRRAFRKAGGEFDAIAFGRGTTYFLGNSAAYGLSVYAAGKVYELLGAKCHPELLEEFSHLEVFSLRKGDAVNVFSCFDSKRMGSKLRRLLTAQGYDAHLIPGLDGPPIENIFRSAFAVQLATLREASARSLTKPKFLASRRSLNVSDQMIY